MKTFFKIVPFLLCSSSAFAANVWKVDSERKIYFAPVARVTVGLVEAQASDDVWDLLQVTLSYESQDAVAEVERLKADNPGYAVGRVLLSKSQNYVLHIPSLGIHQEMDTLPGMEGPYFHADFTVAKKDSARVHEAIRSLSSFLGVEGRLGARIPRQEVVERAVLPHSTCESLFRNGSDLYSVITAFPGVEEKIVQAAKEAANRSSLRDQVLRFCVDVLGSEPIRSFSELLAVKVAPASQRKADFVAEVSRLKWSQETIALEIRTVKAGQQ